MAEVLIGDGAQRDYAQSLKWYAERSMSAAEGFEAEFASALDNICSDPDRFPLCDDRHRFYLLNRYPFQLIYRQLSAEQVLVVAVAHASRHPGYWTGR